MDVITDRLLPILTSGDAARCASAADAGSLRGGGGSWVVGPWGSDVSGGTATWEESNLGNEKDSRRHLC